MKRQLHLVYGFIIKLCIYFIRTYMHVYINLYMYTQ